MKAYAISIKFKIRVALFLIILSAVVCTYLSYHLMNKSVQYSNTRDEVLQVMLKTSTAIKLQKEFSLYGRKEVEFLESGTSELLGQHYQNIGEAKGLLLKLEENNLVKDNNLQMNVSQIRFGLSQYEDCFKKMVELYFERGFKDHGLEGEMRDYVHQLQDCKSDGEKVFAFSLRRHEKDFMLRQDLSYIDKLKKTAAEFKQYILHSDLPHMTPEYKNQSMARIDAYVANFDKLVELEKQIGLSRDEGIRGKLESSSEQMAPTIELFLQRVEQYSESFKRKAQISLVAALVVPLFIGLLVAWYIGFRVTTPILLLNKVTRKVADGGADDEGILENLKSKDEIGLLATNFNEMLKTQQHSMDEIKQKNSALEKSNEEERKRQWAANGLNQFADLLKTYDGDLEKLSFNLVAQLVRYTDSNQAGIFLIDDLEQPKNLILKASYAYRKKKYVKKEIEKGEGLVGTIWIEKSPTLLTDIPKDYIDITSGLGGALPRCIYAVPMKMQENILGVIEIASFKEYDKETVDFIDSIAERIAITINSIFIQERTQNLLENSQMQAEALRAQEEEMRQNMEELSTIQEELNRKNQRMNDQLKEALHKVNQTESIINKVFEGIVVTDQNLRIKNINSYMLSRLHYDENEIVQQEVDSLFAKGKRDVAELIKNDPNFLLHEISSQTTLHLIDRFDTKLKVKAIALRVFADGEMMYSFLFKLREADDDIIDRKYNNKALA